jgi:hypothetical protein
MSVTIYRKDTGQPTTFTHMIDARTGILGGAYSWSPPPKPEEPKPVMQAVRPEPIIEKREIKPEPIIEKREIKPEPIPNKSEESNDESEGKRTPRMIRK